MGEAIAERIRPVDVKRMTGLSLRQVQQLSKTGQIPSAAKLGGIWTYDPASVRGWIKQEERKTWSAARQPPPTSTSEARFGGVGSKSPDESIVARYEQLIGGKRRVALKRGERNSNVKR